MSESSHLDETSIPYKEYHIKYTVFPEESWNPMRHRDFIRLANDAQHAVNLFREELGISPYIISIKLI